MYVGKLRLVNIFSRHTLSPVIFAWFKCPKPVKREQERVNYSLIPRLVPLLTTRASRVVV